MNNLIQNYKIILKELTNICKHLTTTKQIGFQKCLIWNLWHLMLLRNTCQLTLNYSYLDVFQEPIWTEKLKEVSIIKERENFYPTLKKSESL